MHFDTAILRSFLRGLPTRKIRTIQMTMATMPSTITKGTLTEKRSTQETTSNHRRDTVEVKEVEKKLNLSNIITDTKIPTPGTKSSVDSYGTTTQNSATQPQRPVVIMRQTHRSYAHIGANTFTIIYQNSTDPSGTTDQTKRFLITTPQMMRPSSAHHAMKHHHFDRHTDTQNSTDPYDTTTQTKRHVVTMRQIHPSSVHHGAIHQPTTAHSTQRLTTRNSANFRRQTEASRPR